MHYDNRKKNVLMATRYERRDSSGRIRVRCANRPLSDVFASKFGKKQKTNKKTKTTPNEKCHELRATRNKCKPECTTQHTVHTIEFR